MTTLHHTIEAAMVRAKHNFSGNLGTPEGLEGFAALTCLYIEIDVQAWIDVNRPLPEPPKCGAYSPDDVDNKLYPCILPPDHEPIAPNFRTHIDKAGDTW